MKVAFEEHVPGKREIRIREVENAGSLRFGRRVFFRFHFRILYRPRLGLAILLGRFRQAIARPRARQARRTARIEEPVGLRERRHELHVQRGDTRVEEPGLETDARVVGEAAEHGIHAGDLDTLVGRNL